MLQEPLGYLADNSLAPDISRQPPAPVGKHLWGTITIGSKGQIVIPKKARDTFNLKEGDRLVVLGDENEGIALVKAEAFETRMQEALKSSRKNVDE